MQRCNLILDSCCDLPFEVIDKPGIELLRFPYIMSDGEHLDDLYQTTSAHDFYQAMRDGEEPTTAQVAVPVFQEAFGRAIESGVPTVYLSFTSGLSGSFDVACLVRDQLLAEHPEAELYLVDTLQASVAEGLLVYEAIQQRDKGPRRASWPNGPARRVSSWTPSSWWRTWSRCAAAGASPARWPMPDQSWT